MFYGCGCIDGSHVRKVIVGTLATRAMRCAIARCTTTGVALGRGWGLIGRFGVPIELAASHISPWYEKATSSSAGSA